MPNNPKLRAIVCRRCRDFLKFIDSLGRALCIRIAEATKNGNGYQVYERERDGHKNIKRSCTFPTDKYETDDHYKWM